MSASLADTAGAAADNGRGGARGARVQARGWGWRHAGRKAWALHDIDLDITPGERVLVLGASGAGKSTLMGGLAGVLGGEDEGDAAGTLTVDGRAPASQRGRVGLMMQDPEAQVVLARAGDDVAFGCENLGVPREEIWRRVRDALDAVGLDVALDHPTSKLSGGQKQRLALASILAMRPGLLLLDEPTANLDPSGVHEVRDATRRVLERTGATLVVIEHRVDVWADLVDRAVVIMDGVVAADGPLREVLDDQGGALRRAGIWLPGDDVAVVEEARGRLPGRRSAPAGRAPAFHVEHTVLGAQDLTIGYEADRAVRSGVDVEVARGTATCLIGPNGVGKSTLGLTLVGLLRQLDGNVSVSEDIAPGPGRTDPHQWSSHELLGRVSMVFQEPEYQFVERTVRSELEVGPRLMGVRGVELNALVDATLQRLRLDGVALAHPMTLSGGEKRRLSVATALISAPQVVVLDEPTFGQDRSTWLELVGILQDAVAAGTTIVAITHDLSFVRAMGGPVIDLARVGRAPEAVAAEDGSTGQGSPSSAGPGSAGTASAGTGSAEPEAPRPTWRDVWAGRGLRAVNPVIQVIALFVMTTPLLITIDLLSASLALAMELVLVPLCGIPPRRLAWRMLPILVAAPLAAVSMLLYADPAGSEVFWSWGPMIISAKSVQLAGAIWLRVLAVGLPAVALLSRIDPTDMADGLGQVLRLPARPVLASLAGVRMAGLMVGDWRALERARRIRGIGDGNRLAAFFRGAFALLVFALRRSAKLSLTMEARGFGATTERTWARPSVVGRADAVMMVIAVVIPAIAVTAAVHAGVFQLMGR